jgi:hypothetical protein
LLLLLVLLLLMLLLLVLLLLMLLLLVLLLLVLLLLVLLLLMLLLLVLPLLLVLLLLVLLLLVLQIRALPLRTATTPNTVADISTDITCNFPATNHVVHIIRALPLRIRRGRSRSHLLHLFFRYSLHLTIVFTLIIS